MNPSPLSSRSRAMMLPSLVLIMAFRSGTLESVELGSSNPCDSGIKSAYGYECCIRHELSSLEGVSYTQTPDELLDGILKLQRAMLDLG